MKKPDIVCICWPCCDEYWDEANGEFVNGMFTAKIAKVFEGGKIEVLTFALEHKELYKTFLKELKSKVFEGYRLSPRSVVQRMENEENGVYWKDGRYYRNKE